MSPHLIRSTTRCLQVGAYLKDNLPASACFCHFGEHRHLVRIAETARARLTAGLLVHKWPHTIKHPTCLGNASPAGIHATSQIVTSGPLHDAPTSKGIASNVTGIYLLSGTLGFSDVPLRTAVRRRFGGVETDSEPT